MEDYEDMSGLYELSGLKEIFEEKPKDFWEGVETDYWEKEERKEFEKTVQQIEWVDQNLVINRENYYEEVEKRTEGLSNEMSKDIFEDDFKDIQDTNEDEIDPFWLT
jgi:hypothetical protein